MRIRTGNKHLIFLSKRNSNFLGSIICFVDYITLDNFNINSYPFFKNQTRPITDLAKAVKIWKGDYINEFRPSGAREINAAYNLTDGKINRHLNQRSEMLSGISHDLRTPLTRLKLQLAMVNNKEISNNMSISMRWKICSTTISNSLKLNERKYRKVFERYISNNRKQN